MTPVSPRRAATAALLAVACATLFACGGSSETPTAPSPSPAVPTGVPVVARITVAVDALPGRDAIAALSEVSVDASASIGSGALTMTTDFGDGTIVPGTVARHVYQAAGAFVLTAVAKDSQGRTATATQTITVKALTGAWFHAAYVASRTRVEVRRLTIASQDGLAVRGTYEVTGDVPRGFTGTLTAPRAVRLVMDGGASLSGTIPNRLGDSAETWTLQASGDVVDGQQLVFRAVAGDPATPRPDAVLHVRFDSFDAPVPVVGVSSITFDGSSSRGTDLLYFIEFGDGQAAADARAAHILKQPAAQYYSTTLSARLTVVDRMGHADTESIGFRPFLLPRPIDQYFYAAGYATGESPYTRLSTFTPRSDGTYSCILQLQPSEFMDCVAARVGDRDMRITVPSRQLEYTGVIEVSSFYAGKLVLTQRGGAQDGWTVNLRYVEGY